MPKLLIADDNRQITSILAEYAKKEGYTPIVAFDGAKALSCFQTEQPDAALLDVSMPNLDGFTVCKTIRKTSNIPILMITARSEDYDKIMGLDIGADDYIVKPFSPGEVMARLRAVFRRIEKHPAEQENHFTCGNLSINLNDYSASIGGEVLELTKKELEILWTLATNRNKVFSRENLLNSIWGYDYLGDSRTVDSHVKRLRQKLERYGHQHWEIKTIWGVGYKFEIITEASP